jgi:hypothetical protein
MYLGATGSTNTERVSGKLRGPLEIYWSALGGKALVWSQRHGVPSVAASVEAQLTDRYRDIDNLVEPVTQDIAHVEPELPCCTPAVVLVPATKFVIDGGNQPVLANIHQ